MVSINNNTGNCKCRKTQLTGIGNAKDEEKEKLVGSLMFLRNGHLSISSCEGTDSLKSLKKFSILYAMKVACNRRKKHKPKVSPKCKI